MFALIRLAVFGLVALTVVYLCVSIYSRSVRREKLEKRWDAENAQGGDPADRDAYIEDGMRDYEKGLRKKLIVLVYIVPIIAVAVTVYLVNY